jgi:excisionase family DNA binding protein
MNDDREELSLDEVPLYQCLTVNEVAEALRVSTKTVQRLISAGHLKPLRIGRRVLVTQEELLRFERHEVGPAPL